MMQTFFGVLEAYYEQGYEGRIEYALWPDNHVELKSNFPLLLDSGDDLKIFDVNNNLLWQGTLNFVPRRYWLDCPKKNILIYAETKQNGVNYADWLSWFYYSPPLKAELTVRTLVGVLFARKQQGSEGLIDYAFWPDNHAELKLDSPLTLHSSDDLQIFDAPNILRWRGNLNLVSRRFWDRTKRNDLIHATTKQKGVPYADWLSWFCYDPPLRARLKQNS